MNTLTPVQETCFPAEEQQLFLGCSVMSFSVSMGLNGQQSELTVQLTEDDCAPEENNPKKFRDCLLREQDWTDADPGFFGELISIIGTPVYFRVANFEYCGIVQGWERVHSESNNPTYDVKIVDPRIILENTKIIMNDDTGIEPAILTNVYNALYWNEKERPGVGLPCPPVQQFLADGVIAGSLADWYGAANHNNNGLTWDDVLWMVESRINSTDRSDYIEYLSSGGSVVHPEFGTIQGMGLLDETVGFGGYGLDLSEVPEVPSYYRFDNTASSLMDLLNQVIEDSGHDYYVELIPNKANIGSISCAGYPGSEDPYDLIIKVRCIDRRTSVAATGSIETFVNSPTNAEKVLSYNEGRELRNDITESMIIGGQKQSIWQADNGVSPGSIIPYFGLDPATGDVIVPFLNAGFWQFEMPTDDLAMQFNNARHGVVLPAFVTINERELIFAQSNFDVWHSYAAAVGTDLFNALGVVMEGVFDVAAINALFTALNTNPLNDARVADFVNASRRGFPGHESLELEILNMAYSWINKIATEYYGKKFQVLVPFTCTKISLEAMQFINTEKPTDGGWTEEGSIVGLPNPGTFADFFRHQDERFMPFVGFNNASGIELSNLAQDSYITDGVQAWVKVNQEQEYVFVDKSNQDGPRAIITLPQPMREVEALTSTPLAFSAIVDLAARFGAGGVTQAVAQSEFNDIMKKVGAVDGHEGMFNRALLPNGAAVCIESNLLRYGPYSAIGLGTKGGDVNLRIEEGLVPWEYGGYAIMDVAGAVLSSEGITKQQVIDKGTVTIAGYPDLPVGAEILAIENGSLLGNGSGYHLYENRPSKSRITEAIRSDAGNQVLAPLTVLNSGDKWQGTDGANITTISTRVGPQGIQTTYQMRVFTDKFGRFAKLNAKRLKTIGRWRIQLTRYFRAFSRHRLDLLRKQIFNAIVRPGQIVESRWGSGSRTPAEVIVGQLGIWNNDTFQRPMIAQMPIAEASVEVGDDYDKKAMMSIDGFLRPVSVAGGGGLPQFANPLTNCQITASKGAQPPIDKEGEGGNLDQYNLDIDITYLNPFSNPNTNVPTRSDTPDHGHDIELLGRELQAPTGSLMMAPGGYLENGSFDQNDYSTDDDYRTFALRGPLVMQGWGYDLDGFPIPNAIDSDIAAKSGDFENENLQHKFMDNWLRKTETWPVAPIDLRFDRERAVWTVPQYRDLVVELKEDMTGGSGLAKRVEGPDLYDSGGIAIANPELYILDKTCSGVVGVKPLESGDKAIVRFDPESCEYYIIEACRKPVGICTIDVDCCIPDSYRVQDCITGISGAGLEKLAFAQGIRSYTGAKDICPDAGTGITGECCDVEPTTYLMAGISLTKWDNGGADTCKPMFETNLPFVNELLVGDGIRVGTTGGASTGCSGIMAAGIEFATLTSGICPTGGKAGIDFANKVYLGTGLHGTPNTTTLLNDCDYILSAGQSLGASDSGCFPNETQEIEFATRILLGTGLRGASGDACEYHIGAGVVVAKNESCTSGDLNDILPFINRFQFNKGISAQTGGAADECTVNIGAGVHFTNTDDCLTGDAEDSSTTYLSNEILLTKGLKGWYDTERLTNDCNYSIGAGIDFTNAHQGTGSCLDIAQGSLTDFDLVSTINFARGLALETGSDKCEVTIGAGMEVSAVTTCIKNGATIQNMPFVSQFIFGKGLAVSGNETAGACDVSLGAGIEFASSPGCETGSAAVPFANKISLKDGLRSTTGADCEAFLSAGFKAQDTSSTGNENPLSSNAFTNSIIFGSGISMFSGATPCEVIITASGGGSSGINISGSDDCVSGDYTAQFQPGLIEFAKGLWIERVGDNAQIGAGMSMTNVAECVTGESSVTYANDFLIGAGLRVDTGVNACQAKLGAGFDFSTKSGLCLDGQADGEVIDFANSIELTEGIRASGDQDNCKITLGAGLSFEDGNLACITGNETVPFFHTLTSAKGIRGKSGLADCELLLGAGVEFIQTTDCITGNDDAEFINEIELGRGLASQTGADCTLQLGAGFEIAAKSDTCADTGEAISFVNHITPLKGIRIKQGQQACYAEIGAGMGVDNTFDCVTGSDTSPFISTFRFGGGLRTETGDACDVKVGAGTSFTSSTATGVTTATLDFANKIVLGSGLELTTGAECEAIIWSSGSSVGASGTDECITTDDTALVNFNKVKWAKGLRMDATFDPTISVGAGMKWTDSTGCVQPDDAEDVDFASDILLGKGLLAKSGDADCEVVLGAGVELENTTDCVDEEVAIPFASKFKLGLGLRAKTGTELCESIIGAGLDLTKNTDCVTGLENLDIDFVSDIEFGKGISMETGATPNCSAKIGAGVAFSNTTDCVSGSESIGFANEIILGKGLSSETGADCQAKLGAGFEIKDSGNNCITTQEDVDFAAVISVGQGLRSKKSADCEAMMSAGLTISNTSECIVVPQDIDFSANIQLGKGLASKSGILNCAAVLGAGMEIANEATCISGTATSAFINKFTLADGLTSQTGAACEMKIGSAHAYSNAGNNTVAAASVPTANKIELGSGLYAGPGSVDCSVLIYASGEAGKVSGCSDDACVTTEDAACLEFSQITFGGGLRKEDVAAGHIRVGAGIGASQTAGCLTSSGGVDYFNKIVGRDGIRLYSDTACELQIGAGIAVTNAGTGCFDTGSSSAFATTINFGGGLRAKDDGTCAASVIAGPKIEVGDECGSNITPATVELSNTFRIGSGLKVGQGSEDNCTTDWAAGFAGSFETGCPESFGGGGDVDFFNKMVFVGGDGYGITGESDTECEIKIGAGSKIVPSVKCVKTEQDRDWIGKLNVGKGLRAGSGDGDADCEATIDLFLKVEGMGSAEGQKIKLMGECAPAVSEEDEGDCKNIILTFGDSGMLTVVTDVSLGACDIIQTKVPITFCGTTGASFTGSVAPLTDCSGDLGCAGQ